MHPAPLELDTMVQEWLRLRLLPENLERVRQMVPGPGGLPQQFSVGDSWPHPYMHTNK